MPARARLAVGAQRSLRSSREAPRTIPDREGSGTPRHCLGPATAPRGDPIRERTEVPGDTHGRCRRAQGQVGLRSSALSGSPASSTCLSKRKTSIVGEPMEKCAVKPHHLLEPAMLFPPGEDVADKLTPW